MTALRVALRRAAHQLVDDPVVFADPLAEKILGPSYAEELRRTPDKAKKPSSGALRAFLVARSRYAEEQVASAYAAGVRQYCLLGAGLDTFAYRQQFDGLRVFEVDHPETQAWKKNMLAGAGIAIPATVRFVAVDFERQSLAAQLRKSGFDFAAPCFFSWLGVVVYLTLEAFQANVALIAAMPEGTCLTFDYALPRAALSPTEQLERDSLASRVAQAGEPFRLFLTPEEMQAELKVFSAVEDLDSAAISNRFFAGRTDGFGLHGSQAHLVTARV